MIDNMVLHEEHPAKGTRCELLKIDLRAYVAPFWSVRRR